MANHEAAIKLILQAIEQAGNEPGTQIALGLDCAASEFYKDGKYRLDGEGLTLSSADFTNLLATWCDKYPIKLLRIEEGLGDIASYPGRDAFYNLK